MTIKVHDIEKKYAGAAEPVLRGVSFELEKGQLGAILGSSGAVEGRFMIG